MGIQSWAGRSKKMRSRLLVHDMETMGLFTDPDASAREITAPREAIWEVLPSVHEALSIPLSIADQANYQMGNDGYWARHIEGDPLSRYIDCGRGRGAQNAVQYRATLFVMTRHAQVDGGGTMVETTVTGTASPRDVRGNSVNCSTVGRLELRIAQLIVEALGG